MQKKIIALAIAAAFATPVVAMADVTMYGTMDGGFRHQTNDSATQGTTDSMQMGQYNTARFGLKSVEDMGDGMKTNVVLETSYAPGGVGTNSNMTAGATPATTATTAPTNVNNPFGLLFDRQATIGVSAGWGSIDMGWNYTTSFKTIASYDPLGYKWLGQAGAKTSDTTDRAGNLVYNGKFGDVGVTVEYDVNNAAKTYQPATGAGRAVGVQYASGAINVGAAYTAQEGDTFFGYDDSMTHVTVGGGYNFGDGKISVGYAKKAIKGAAGLGDNTNTNTWLGGNYNVSSKINVLAAYYNNATNSGAVNAADATKKIMIVGATYSLSKMTSMYVSFDKTTANTGATNAQDVVTNGSTLGLSTTF